MILLAAFSAMQIATIHRGRRGSLEALPTTWCPSALRSQDMAAAVPP
jgi:hypothetical protein